MKQLHEISLTNALRAWALIRTRPEAEMERARKLAVTTITELPAELAQMEIEKAILVKLRDDEMKRLNRWKSQ